MSQQFKNSIFTTILGVLGLFIHFAQQSILARLIEPSEYAIFLSLGYLSFMSVFFNCLMPLLVVKRLTVLNNNLNEASNYFSVYSKILNWISIVCFSCLVITLPWVQAFLNIPIPYGVLITFIYLIAIIFFAFYTAVLQSFGKFKLIAGIQLLQAVIRFICVIAPSLFLKSNHQISSAGLLISVIITNFLLIYYCHHSIGLKRTSLAFKDIHKRIRSLKADAKYAINTSLMYSFIILFNSFDIPLSRYLFNENLNVSFAPLASLSKLCYSVPAMIIGVYFPSFIQAHHSCRNGYKELVHALFLTFTLALGITIVLNFDPDLLVKIIFGSRYSGSENTLIYTCLSMSCLSLISVLAHYYMAFEHFFVLVLLLIFLIIQFVAVIAQKSFGLLQYVQVEAGVFAILFLLLLVGVKMISLKGRIVNVEATR